MNNTAKNYVLKYFPDATYEHRGIYHWIWIRHNKEQKIIGESIFSVQAAWEIAKQWIDSLPEDKKPKIK